jgi:nucleoside 2-deoxyribosyltransferase/putative methionine-R-sulfoxide reductase with GAF domain
MHDDPSLLLSILDNARALLKAEGGSIFLLEGENLSLRAAAGSEGPRITPLYYAKGSGLTGYVFQTRRSVSVNAVDDFSRWQPYYDQAESRSVSNLIAAPVMLGDTAIGVIRCTNKRTREGSLTPFTEDDGHILEAFARTAAAAIAARKELLFATNAPYTFVLMPFSDEFRDVYEFGIKSVATSLGIRCERVDEIQFNDSILEQVRKGIQSADIVIADMSGRNPNVFYEVGYAHALQKQVILLTQQVPDIPFDLKTHNHIVYEGRIARLKELLTKRLEAWLASQRKELNE